MVVSIKKLSMPALSKFVVVTWFVGQRSAM